MSKLLRKLQRIGKHAVKYHVEVVYRELELTCAERWQPNKLIVSWSHHSRHEQTSSHSLEPSIPQPSLGYVRWPPTGERSTFDVTLYYDPFAHTYEEKYWLLTVEELTRSGERRILAKQRVSIIDLSNFPHPTDPSGSVATVNKAEKSEPVASVSDNGASLHLRTFELQTVSSKVSQAKLTVHFKVEADTEANERVPLGSGVRGEDVAPRGPLRRFSTRIRQTFRRRRNAPTTRSERHPVRPVVDKQVHLPTRSSADESQAQLRMNSSFRGDSLPKQASESADLQRPASSPSCQVTASVEEPDHAAVTVNVTKDSQLTVTAKETHENEKLTPDNSVVIESVVNSAAAASLHQSPLKVSPTVTPTSPQNVAKVNVNGTQVASRPVSTIAVPDENDCATSVAKVDLFTPVKSGEQEELLTWCKTITAACKTVRITNWTTSFRNGLAFCAIIQHFRPAFIDVSKMNAADMVENNRRAFDLANRYFGVTPPIEPSAIVSSFIPDRTCVIGYVTALRTYFAQHSQPTELEFEQFRIDSQKSNDVAMDGEADEDEDDVVELRHMTSSNDATKRSSGGSAKKVLGALKKRSSSGLQKLLNVGRSSAERDAELDADDKDKDKDKRGVNGTPERDERGKSSESDRRSKHTETRSDESTPKDLESPSFETPSEKQFDSPDVSANASVVSTPHATSVVASANANVNESFSSASVVRRVKARDSGSPDVDSEQDSSHRSSHSHRSSKLFKRFSKHHDDDGNEHKQSGKPSVAVAPATRSSTTPSTPNGGEKRDVNGKAELSSNSLKISATNNELNNEITKMENEMADVDARLAVVEARLREIMQSRTRTLDSHNQTPHPPPAATSKLSAFGRTLSMRKNTQTPASQVTYARKDPVAEQEQLLVKQRVALTNHKNTLVHKLNRLNLLLQDEELDRLNETNKNQLQELSKLQDWEKSEEQRKQEERLTVELLDIVRRRNQIVQDIDENEQELERAIEMEEKMRHVNLDDAQAEKCVIS